MRGVQSPRAQLWRRQSQDIVRCSYCKRFIACHRTSILVLIRKKTIGLSMMAAAGDHLKVARSCRWLSGSVCALSHIPLWQTVVLTIELWPLSFQQWTSGVFQLRVSQILRNQHSEVCSEVWKRSAVVRNHDHTASGGRWKPTAVVERSAVMEACE
jgi:hypothetical protein